MGAREIGGAGVTEVRGSVAQLEEAVGRGDSGYGPVPVRTLPGAG
jgi:hypothetical protein